MLATWLEFLTILTYILPFSKRMLATWLEFLTILTYILPFRKGMLAYGIKTFFRE